MFLSHVRIIVFSTTREKLDFPGLKSYFSDISITNQRERGWFRYIFKLGSSPRTGQKKMKTLKITLRLGVNSLFLFYSAKVKYQEWIWIYRKAHSKQNITFWWRITENFRLNNSRSFSIFTSNFSFSEISYKNTENQSTAIVKVNVSFKPLRVQLLNESTIANHDWLIRRHPTDQKINTLTEGKNTATVPNG